MRCSSLLVSSTKGHLSILCTTPCQMATYPLPAQVPSYITSKQGETQGIGGENYLHKSFKYYLPVPLQVISLQRAVCKGLKM